MAKILYVDSAPKRQIVDAGYRERILTTAEKLLEHLPVAELSTRTLCKMGQFSVGSLTNTIKADELILELIGRNRARFQQALPPPAVPSGQLAYLRALSDAILSVFTKHPNLASKLELEGIRRGIGANDTVRGLIRLELKAQVFGPLQPKMAHPELASSYLSGVMMVMAEEATLGERENAVTAAARMTETALAMIRSPHWGVAR